MLTGAQLYQSLLDGSFNEEPPASLLYLKYSTQLPKIWEIFKNNIPEDMFGDFYQEISNIYKGFPIWLLDTNEPTDPNYLWLWHKYRLHIDLVAPYHEEIRELCKPVIYTVDGEIFPSHCIEPYLGTLLTLLYNDNTADNTCSQTINNYKERVQRRLESNPGVLSTLSPYKHVNCGCQACYDWCDEEDHDKNEQIYWLLDKVWQPDSTILDNISKVVINLYYSNATCQCPVCAYTYKPISLEQPIQNNNILCLSDLEHIAADIKQFKHYQPDVTSLETECTIMDRYPIRLAPFSPEFMVKFDRHDGLLHINIIYHAHDTEHKQLFCLGLST